MKNTTFIIETEIGKLAIIHYHARKEVERLKQLRGDVKDADYYKGFSWDNDEDVERRKITLKIHNVSKAGRIAKYKMICLIKKVKK